MSVAASMAPIAGQQHGLFHLRQTHAQGVSREALAWARKTGEVERVLPEVYAIAGVPRTWPFSVMAAVLDGGPDAIASHRTSAVMLGVARRDAPRLVEITLPRTKYSRSAGAIVHRSGDLSPEHVVTIDGIPCAGPLRTLVDLGAVEPWWEVRDALERALQGSLCTILGCEWMLARLSERGRSGCGVFRRVLDDRALLGASPHPGLLEPRFAGLARRFGLPPYEYQHKVFDAKGGFLAQVDFAYPELKLAIEVDGFEHHGTPKAVVADLERDHRLEVENGWYVIHFTWFHVVKRPKIVADRIKAVLVARRRALHV